MAENVGIYLRISDDREGRELGVERQDEDCRALVGRCGDRVVDVYKDNDISASTRSKKVRPEYRRLLADARSGTLTKIVAYTSGRLTRRPRELEDQIDLAEKYGTKFQYVASPSFDLNTAAGRRVARILAANDAGEAEDISERVIRSKAKTAAQGKYRGGRRPFGFEPDGVTQRKVEADAIEDAIHRVLAGESMRSIFSEWNEAGLLTSTGRRWDGSCFRQMLERPRNAGLIGTRQDGGHSRRVRIIGPAQWSPIVDRDTWEAFVAHIDDPSRVKNDGNRSLRLVGSFLFLCQCGQVVKSGGNSARGEARYTCSTESHMRRLAAPVDKLVHTVVEELLAKKGVTLLRPREDLTPLRKRLTLLRERSKMVAREFGDPDSKMTMEQFRIANDPLQVQIREAEAELARRNTGSALAGIADADDPVAAYRASTTERQRGVIDDLMTVTLRRAPRGRQGGGFYFDPESVVITPKRVD
jgi:site-specific DNA recombinase